MAHFLILSFPIHGSLHPTLHLARCLARAGALVTYTTSLSAHRRIIEEFPATEGLSYAVFSDGHDDDFNYNYDREFRDPAASTAKIILDDKFDAFVEQFIKAGAEKLSELVRNLKEEGRPVTCVIYGMLQSWAADVAHELQTPSVALWTQPASVLAVYYRYFNGYDHLIERSSKDPNFLVELPGLPPLSSKDLPNFLTSSSPGLTTFRDQFDAFDKEVQEFKLKPRVLVNTFEALECDAIASIDRLGPIPIGPLIPYDFFVGKGTWATMSMRTSDYMKWLDSKPVSSVVYISFGTLVHPSKRQMDEILNGLLDSGRPFLWVIRGPESGSDMGSDAEIRSRIGGAEQGLVVSWCSQVEVLSHTSTGCFVTHCGWNSTLESLAVGVPMVCFPQWTDQMTNAKLVEDFWKAGVKVRADKDGIMEGGELKRCLEEVMGGQKGEEIKKNAEKLKGLAREAVGKGGSSDRNIRAFVEEMTRGC